MLSDLSYQYHVTSANRVVAQV